MLDKYDLVFSHIEAPDEASHQADWKTKVQAIEHIDKFIVGPVLEKLKTFPDWRILVMPDHPTNIAHAKARLCPDAVRDGRFERRIEACAGGLQREERRRGGPVHRAGA